MGFFDKLKKTFGGGDEAETVKGPSMVLREKGIDPQGLKFAFGSGGSLTVSGDITDESARGPILEALGEMPQISTVVDEMQVAVAAPPEPEPAPEPAVVAEPEAAGDNGAEAAGDNGGEAAGDNGSEADEGKTYTVQPGDTLWKIAQETLGNGSKYMKIFEANTDLLENPDRIFPGQVLKIPESED